MISFNQRWIQNAIHGCITVGILTFISMSGFHMYQSFDEIGKKRFNRKLNRYMPSFVPILLAQANNKSIDVGKLREYVRYYENISNQYPSLAAPYGMLGYVYFELGQKDQAIESLEKAIEKNKHFVWFYHNLGLIHFKEQQYEKAAENFLKGMFTKPEISILFMKRSRIYRQIIEGSEISDFNAPFSTQQGIEQCFRMLLITNYRMGRYTEVLRMLNSSTGKNFTNQAIYRFYGGLAAMKLENFHMALAYFQESLIHNDRDYEVYYHMGLALKKIGKEEMAQITLKKSALLRLAANEAFEDKEDLNLRVY